MIRCGKCGRDNADGMRFCTTCGALIETAASGGSSSTAADPPSPDTLSFSAPPPTSPTGWPTIGSFAPPPPAQPVDKGRGSNTGLIVGVIVVLLLGVAGAAGVVGWDLFFKTRTEGGHLNKKPEDEEGPPAPRHA